MPQLCFWGFFIIHFIFTSFTQTSGTLLSIVCHGQLEGFSDSLFCLEDPSSLEWLISPHSRPSSCASTLRFHVTIFFLIHSMEKFISVYFALFFQSWIGLFPVTRIVLDFFLDPYLLPSTHYLAFSANIMCWRKPFLSMPVCIR